MFSLKNQNTKLSDVNPRAELHGQDTQLAVDLKLEIRVSNDVLSEFEPQLKSALYKEGGQQDILDEPGALNALKFPMIGPIKYTKDFVGYDFIAHFGLGGPSDIKLIGCKVNNFVFHCQEGGTVSVAFRVQANTNEHEIGKLCGLIQRDVEISLIPPDEQSGAQLELVEGNGTNGADSSRAKNVTWPFPESGRSKKQSAALEPTKQFKWEHNKDSFTIDLLQEGDLCRYRINYQIGSDGVASSHYSSDATTHDLSLSLAIGEADEVLNNTSITFGKGGKKSFAEWLDQTSLTQVGVTE